MERGETDFRAAAGMFGSVYLFSPVSPVASLAAGVRTSGFAARAPCSSYVCVCEREEGKDNKFYPYRPPLRSPPSEKEANTQRPARLLTGFCCSRGGLCRC